MRIYPPTEAHKRLVIPNRSLYTGYITCLDGKWVYRNNNNETLKEFSNEEECKTHCNIISETIYEIYNLLYNQYISHKTENPEYYRATYEEANMTLRFYYKEFISYHLVPIASGFVDNSYVNFSGLTWVQKLISPNENWFGVSVYHPDWIFIREDKSIHMSLQGMSMPYPNHGEIDDLDGFEKMIKNGGLAKYICFRDGDSIVYRNWYGNLPSQEFIENFIQ